MFCYESIYHPTSSPGTANPRGPWHLMLPGSEFPPMTKPSPGIIPLGRVHWHGSAQQHGESVVRIQCTSTMALHQRGPCRIHFEGNQGTRRRHRVLRNQCRLATQRGVRQKTTNTGLFLATALKPVLPSFLTLADARSNKRWHKKFVEQDGSKKDAVCADLECG